jgi:hypothetical protein
MTRLLFGLVALLGMTGSAADAHLPTTGAGGTAGGSGPPTITGLVLSNAGFPAGAPSGTLVGAITVQMTGGSFSGSLALGGTDAARFALSGSNLLTSGVLGGGSYAINLVATQPGAVASPLAQPETIVASNGTTWDPAHLGALTLSNGNLTATAASVSSEQAARGTAAHASPDKVYFEVTATQAAGSPAIGPMLGLGTASAAVNTYPGASIASYGFQCRPDISASVTYYNGGGVVGFNQFDYCATGDVMGVAVDLGAKKVWINDWTKRTGWNHGSGGMQDPATGGGGISISGISGSIYPMFGGYFVPGSPAPSMTINPGSSAFTGTVPTGFSPWN